VLSAACASRAGITLITRMYPDATDAMWHGALVTKAEQMKNSKRPFNWFDQPITAKEKDIDALAGEAYVKY
jgi:hypothetical protein